MKKFSIELTLQHLEVISAGLVELPFKISAPVIQHINAEIQKAHDENVDSVDTPSGHVVAVNEFSGD